MVLRLDSDWSANIQPGAVVNDGDCAEFRFSIDGAFSYFKPVLIRNGIATWARGNNYLVLAHEPRTHDIYPYFFDDRGCTPAEISELAAPDSQTHHEFHVFTPPGYQENPLKRYPVLYLQDGQNVFFASESFTGADWRIGETLTLLNAMNVIDKVIAVGIYPREREQEYTYPGYTAYGRFVAKSLKPRIDAAFRTLDGPENTAIMGSSLGGVASLYLAWQWPGVFGMTACLSSTFGRRDDLQQRIAVEMPRKLKIYLDSGWPEDNYEVTRDMRALLLSRGYREGQELMYFAFPGGLHNEKAWALRSHLPFQYFFGRRHSPPVHN